MARLEGSLTELGFSLIGPGRVGSSLAIWAVSGGATLKAVAGRTPASGRKLASELGGQAVAAECMETVDDDLLLVAVSDDALPRVVHQLSSRQQAAVILHTSGRHPAEVLADLRTGGSAVGSIHPLKAFPTVVRSTSDAAGTVFGVDGDEAASQLARRLIDSWAGVAVDIPSEARSLYHLAATVAAGGVVTLVASAVELARRLGLSPQVAGGYLKLAEDALAQAATAEPVASAITGPLARGELDGFEQQLAELRTMDPDFADLLDRLARRTIRLVE